MKTAAQPTAPAPAPASSKTVMARALASLIDGNAADMEDRCSTVAACVMALWQNSAGPMTRIVPDMFLVNGGGQTADPLDVFAENMVYSLTPLEERVEEGNKRKDPNLGEGARKAMLLCLDAVRKGHGSRKVFDRYKEIRINNHGCGPAARYARCWTPESGWITGSENRVVLRLHQPSDREEMRADILQDATRFMDPIGLDQSLQRTNKSIALSGSLPPPLWDTPLVDKLLLHGRPVVFLPHSVCRPPHIENPINIHLRCMQLAALRHPHTISADSVDKFEPWVDHYHSALFKRLAHTPHQYAFHIQRIVRELCGVCVRIAGIHAEGSQIDQATPLLARDLYVMTLRSIHIGVACLAYHAWGFDPGCPRAFPVALLGHLRKYGTATKRDVQRKVRMHVAELDALLARLAEQGLVEIQGKDISAVPFATFLTKVRSMPEHPKPGCVSRWMLGLEQTPAGPLPKNT